VNSAEASLSEPSTDSGALAAGSRIAGYTIEQQIGRGGMAVVYRASDGRLNRPVALKILAPEFASDEGFRQRFIREMRAAAAVDHPNIVPVFDAGEADGELFIAMRYVSGQDVRTLLAAERRLPAARVAHLTAQAASALDEAHSRGLVHRDVKPGNMLLGSGQADHLYLSDFGLSKQLVSSAPLTLTGQFLGTLDYMAPEQIEGRDVDGRTDLYALACTAFEMLTGEPPFRRDQGLAVMWAQVSAPAPSLRALRPDLPPAVDQVVARALAKSPDDRYRSCTEFARALAAACDPGRSQAAGQAHRAAAAPTGPPTERARIPASAASWQPAPRGPAAASWPPAPPASTGYRAAGPPARRRRRIWPLAAACLVLLAIVGVGLAVLHGRNSPGSATPPAATAGKQAGSALAGPAATVQAYIAAINAHDYARAWSLGGKSTGSSYQAFMQGFSGTARDDLTVVSVTGNVVTVKLAATQTDGSVKSYQGTYAVTGGVITQSHIQPAG
jgi:Protein kinase domain